MAHEQNPASHAKTLPADLSAPAFVDGWKKRALMVGMFSMIVALLLILAAQGQDHLGFDHFFRAWVLGTVLTFGSRLAAWRCSWCSTARAASGACCCAGRLKR